MPRVLSPLCDLYRVALKRQFGHSPLMEFNAPESNEISSPSVKLTHRDTENTLFKSPSL